MVKTERRMHRTVHKTQCNPSVVQLPMRFSVSNKNVAISWPKTAESVERSGGMVVSSSRNTSFFKCHRVAKAKSTFGDRSSIWHASISSSMHALGSSCMCVVTLPPSLRKSLIYIVMFSVTLTSNEFGDQSVIEDVDESVGKRELSEQESIVSSSCSGSDGTNVNPSVGNHFRSMSLFTRARVVVNNGYLDCRKWVTIAGGI